MTAARSEALIQTPAERADEAATMARARVSGAVRLGSCPLCGARPYHVCQVSPPGDHLARHLAAFDAGRVSRDDVKTAIGALVVISPAAIVPEGRRTA